MTISKPPNDPENLRRERAEALSCTLAIGIILVGVALIVLMTLFFNGRLR